MSKATKFYNQNTGEMQWYSDGAFITDPLVIAEIEAACADECDLTPSVIECCTGGATETTAKCANISKSWTTMSLGTYDRCTASFGGIDLPEDNYTYADFEALILGVGGTIEPNPNNPDQYTICVPDGFRTCYDRACFNGNIGQLTRACVVAIPNTTEPECTGFQRTWGKYEEPIANTLATSLDVQEDILEKTCANNDIFNAVKKVKPGGIEDADYTGATQYINGRPQASSPWELVDNRDPLNQVIVASGANLNEFVADLESQGYTEWSTGEQHWICPCPPGLVNQGDYFINVAGETSVKLACTPAAEVPDFPADKAAPEDTCVFQTDGCKDAAILAALESLVTDSALQTAKLCVIEQNSNPAAPCSKPVEGLDKEALTLTLAGDVTANYPEGQSIDLQNANAESCGSATSAGGAKYDSASDVTVIPIVECELDEGKEPVVITLAQPVKAVTLQAIKTIKTLTAVRTVVKTAEKV